MEADTDGSGFVDFDEVGVTGLHSSPPSSAFL